MKYDGLSLRAGAMHAIHEPRKLGKAEIRIDEPDRFTRLRGAISGQPLYADKYTRLLVDGELFMTDAEFECDTNRSVVQKMRGDVLIAGLGIGLILVPILKNPIVASVTVLENSKDVIALVAPKFEDKKLKVIKADCITWEPPKKSYDSIYFDIWPNVPNEDDALLIKTLKARYKPALRPKGWIAAWCESYARRSA